MEEIDICIPALNEGKIILSTIDSVLAVCDQSTEYIWKVTVIDNGSSDMTAEQVLSHDDSRVHILYQPKSGKGSALSFAAQKCVSDILVYIDADLSAEPSYILDLLNEIKKGADIAVGSRLLNSNNVHRSIWRTITSHIFRLYAEFLVPSPVIDSQCGLKMMNRKGIEILASCHDTGWFFDRELLAKAAKRKLIIVEVPVAWEEFRYPDRKSKLHVIRDGLKTFYKLWIIRNTVRNFK